MARVLLVLDGSYRFAAGATPAGIRDFTYVDLVNALGGAGHQITKAHRQSDSTADAGFQSFRFDGTTNLLEFDVIWLIGFSGRNSTSGSGTSGAGIDDSEIARIAAFMDAGGGVFATGDHDSIGAEMSGRIPRVRAMRCWYGPGDSASPMPVTFPRNFLPLGTVRADTTQQSPLSDYGLDNNGVNEGFVWFENQSDSIPQTITPTASPAHPILRRGGSDITVFPDHMHEGNTLGVVGDYDYTQTLTFAGQPVVEFPAVAGHRELPEIVATGQSVPFASRRASAGGAVLDPAIPSPKTVGTLSVYDGREAGVGRVVTGATFHHYVDINLSGDSSIDTPAELALTGPDAAKGRGFANPGAEVTFDNIKAVFLNITHWLARPRPVLQLILERSTFSQDEAAATPSFPGAILVTVDGLKPSQFPGSGITSLSPSAAQLASWAPSLSFATPTGLTLVPTAVSSDDPTLPDRLQRMTFTYQLQIIAAAFGFAGDVGTVRLDASLASAAVATPMTDFAFIQLVKSANPFMLDLANGNPTPWLSSDLRVFRVVAGGAAGPGGELVNNASREQALTYLRSFLRSMSVAQFESLPRTQEAATLSALPTTTGTNRRVYNFAVARVRLAGTVSSANEVRVFFRIFTSQTTAALTYRESPTGTPLEGYRRSAGASPIALPGTNNAGDDWLSFPMFAASRSLPPQSQTDPDNVKSLSPGSDRFFGALIDNNLTDPYLPPTPISTAAPTDLPMLMMGEHQCIVAQIEFAGTPIPSGANPFTSDKLSQRNLALSAIANPGLDASRVALHTFEIEATPSAVSAELPPDELLLDWRSKSPDRTEVRLFIPSWSAEQVVALADRFYPRHEVRMIDANTIGVPGDGVRYLPIPPSTARQTGVVTVHFPIGVKQGQRFDLAVRQITTRGRAIPTRPPKEQRISPAEAAKLIKSAGIKTTTTRRAARNTEPADPIGVFQIGPNRTLITDLRVLDADGDDALLIEHPDPAEVAKARREEGSWRETIGAFQLGIPVLVKADMLDHHLRLLSVMRWRAEFLLPASRWYAAFIRYVELLADKVRALGGDPWKVPATPDGDYPSGPNQPAWDPKGETGGAGGEDPTDCVGAPWFEPGEDEWLGDTTGRPAPEIARPLTFTGKVSGLLHDHFGDFEGFTLEDYAGTHRRFFSREDAIGGIARTALADRSVVTVVTVSVKSRHVRRLLIRGS